MADFFENQEDLVMSPQTPSPVLRALITLSSAINLAGGLVLAGTWAVNWASDPQRHVPLIVLAIGGSMIIQAVYTGAYVRGTFNPWGAMAAGALLAGQLISGCVGLGMVISGLTHVSETKDFEAAPVLAGILIGINALLALILLLSTRTIVLSRSREESSRR
jgi:hypothetical protein